MTSKDRLISEIIKLGFKDTTDEKPVEMIEMFGDTFDDIHAYSHRFIKEEFGF